MLKNACSRILEDSSIFRFFGHLPRPFGKISILANFFKVYSVGLNACFLCPEVRWMLKNTCMKILED